MFTLKGLWLSRVAVGYFFICSMKEHATLKGGKTMKMDLHKSNWAAFI